MTRTRGSVTSASPTSAPPGQDTQHPGGQTGLFEDASQHDAAATARYVGRA